MSFKKIEISEITFFDADGNELIGAGAHRSKPTTPYALLITK